MLLPLLMLGACSSPEPASLPAQNLVLVVLDTTRADHLQTYGYGRSTSPGLLRFADRAVVFDRAYAHAPWTKPSVASLFTSRLPNQHGIQDWDHPLDPAFTTLAEHLAGQGFETAAFVSHHALKPEATNFEQGFASYDASVLEKGSPHRVSSSREISDAAMGWLDAAPDDRWFLFLHYFDPHIDYLQHEEHPFGDASADAYDSEIAFTDHHLARVLDALADDAFDDTLVVVVADHGEGLGDHGIAKHTKHLYDHQVRVPLLLAGPELAPARVPGAVGLVDVAPTLLDLLGTPPGEGFLGQPIPRSAGGFVPDPKRPVFAETQRFAKRQAVVLGDHKLIVDREEDRAQLFDLASDPAETTNLAATATEKLAELRSVLDVYAGTRTEVEAVPLDPDMEEALRSLGYLE